MPTRELNPYIAMVPGIAAQRAIAAAEQVAVGMGRLPAAAHRATVSRWHAAVRQGGAAKAVTHEQLAGLARGSGIGFRVVPAKSKAAT